jgi:DNA polymerase-3 subunit epsilon
VNTAGWRRLLGTGAAGGIIDERRWIVVDVETTGLDVEHDELLAIAAVAVRFAGGDGAPRISAGDSFEAVLRRDAVGADKANVLLHGIGVGEQRDGRAPAEVLAAFERWVGASPLIAFHAAFDEAMIGRAMRRVSARAQPAMRNPWLDLEPVAAALHRDVTARALDDWLAHFRIPCARRHQAAADVLATAELLLRLWPAARAERCTSFGAMSQLARDRRWLG